MEISGLARSWKGLTILSVIDSFWGCLAQSLFHHHHQDRFFTAQQRDRWAGDAGGSVGEPLRVDSSPDFAREGSERLLVSISWRTTRSLMSYNARQLLGSSLSKRNWMLLQGWGTCSTYTGGLGVQALPLLNPFRQDEAWSMQDMHALANPGRHPEKVRQPFGR